MSYFYQTMLYSMTGYGQAEVKGKPGTVSVEIRSVNNRYFELQTRLPRMLAAAEPDVNDFIKKNLARGSVNVSAYISDESKNNRKQLNWDKAAAGSVVAMLKKLKKEFGLAGDVSVDTLSRFPELLGTRAVSLDRAAAWAVIKKPLALALEKVNAMRKAEGGKLEESIISYIALSKERLEKIKMRAPARVAKYREQLKGRVAELVKDANIDQARFDTEVALMADRLDISEECVRLESHFKQFVDALKQAENAGKRLNFLLQEMNREANTIGSKANDAEISGHCVYLKEYFENMREQVQNIV